MRHMSLAKGFTSGIAVALSISLMVFLGVHLTSAQGFESGSTSTGSTGSTTPPPTPTPGPFVPAGTTPTPVTPPQPTAPTAPATGTTYAALGDSVAAGLGLPLSSPPNYNDMQCGRSPQGYPAQVAKALGKTLLNVSCSGATAGDLVTKQGVSGPNIPSQISQAYANGAPGVISITAGANDMQWATIIKKCYATDCGTATDTTLVNAALVALQAKLYAVFGDISLRSVGTTPPKVLITGYYNPLSAQCANIAPQQLNADEVVWATSVSNALNQTIKDVATKFSYATYVPIDFTGHDLCSANSWVQSAQEAAPVHPNAAGQAAIAQAVIQAAGKRN